VCDTQTPADDRGRSSFSGHHTLPDFRFQASFFLPNFRFFIPNFRFLIPNFHFFYSKLPFFYSKLQFFYSTAAAGEKGTGGQKGPQADTDVLRPPRHTVTVGILRPPSHIRTLTLH
jgi:hypothetical protein